MLKRLLPKQQLLLTSCKNNVLKKGSQGPVFKNAIRRQTTKIDILENTQQTNKSNSKKEKAEKTRSALWAIASALTVSSVVVAYYFTFQFKKKPEISEEYVQRAPVFVSPQREKKIIEAREAVKEWIAEQQMPGCAISVFIDKELVWSEAFGESDVEQKVLFKPTKTVLPITGKAATLLRATIVCVLASAASRSPSPAQQTAAAPAEGEAAAAAQPPAVTSPVIDLDDPRVLRAVLHDDNSNNKQFVQVISELLPEGYTYEKFIKENVFRKLQLEHTYPQSFKKIIPYRSRTYSKTVVEQGEERVVKLANTVVSADAYSSDVNDNFYISAEDLSRVANQMLLHSNEIIRDTKTRQFFERVRLEISKDTLDNAVIITDEGAGYINHLTVLPKSKTIIATAVNSNNVELDKTMVALANDFTSVRSTFKRIRNAVTGGIKKMTA